MPGPHTTRQVSGRSRAAWSGFRLLPPDKGLGWTPYAWLIYLSFFLVSLFFRPSALTTWLWHGAVVAVFLALYFRGFWLEGRRLVPVIGGIALLGAVAIPFNPGASCFFIYAAAFLGDAGRPRLVVPWLAGLVAFIGAEAWLLSLPPYAWVPAVVFSIIIGGTNIHFSEVGRANARLRLAQDRVEAMATVAERERISRDLHDLLGHTLSVIVLKSELASKLADHDAPRATAEIRDVERISREALTEVRRAVEGYRARGFPGELAAGQAALAAAGVHLVTDVATEPLPPAVETTLALVLREGLTNVVRHAHATRCHTSLDIRDGRAQLVIEDDGVGGTVTAGSGLAGMRERVEQMGGALTVSSGSGLRVEATLPLPAGSSSFGVVPT
jgi:two-component system, NarL family, sensor histidine kinase DesK